MDDVEILSTIVGLLKKLEPEAQQRVLHSVQTFLAIPSQRDAHPSSQAKLPQSSFFVTSPTDFSRDRTLSPKEFIRDKHPITEGDRVICLAYYLTHYRDTPHFKTVDISGLNTEAAQPKLSNPSVTIENATKGGYLVVGTKGNKQISAVGEKYVELLPDKEAAREALQSLRTKRIIRKRKSKSA